MIKKDREMIYMMFTWIMACIWEEADETFLVFLERLRAWRDEE